MLFSEVFSSGVEKPDNEGDGLAVIDDIKENEINTEVKSSKPIHRKSEAGEIQIDGEEYVFPVAKTKHGMLLGRVEQSKEGQRILAFRGIRHLKPPTGELRFKPPVEADSWDGIIDAKTNGPVCPQHLITRPDIWVGEEDCLWLNVFTRDLVSERGRPVIVWIHGGSFSSGSAADYDPDFMLDEDIVLVTIQYRLNMFGFLSTESSAAPGNYGMLDQVAALKWVQENIRAFSGDPDMVTIMGQQAGGASVHYHILSPITRGLFNRGISLSGTALAWWASIKRPQEKARKLGHLLNCPHAAGDKDHSSMIECIRRKPLIDLMNALPVFYEWKHLMQTREPLTVWSPRVDNEAEVDKGQLSYMPEEPIDIMESGKFRRNSWITGVTDQEGATRASAFFSDIDGRSVMENDYVKIAPLMFGMNDGQSEAPQIMVGKVKDHYFGDKISEASLVDALSDSSYSYPALTAAKLHAKHGANVFLYHFGFKGNHSLSQVQPNVFPPTLLHSSLDLGVGNGDDLIYLFPILSGLFLPFSSKEDKFSSHLRQLFVSFTKSGRPLVQLDDDTESIVWSPISTSGDSEVLDHLSIGNSIGMDKGLPNHARMDFWKSLPVYWRSNRENYKPAYSLGEKEEL